MRTTDKINGYTTRAIKLCATLFLFLPFLLTTNSSAQLSPANAQKLIELRLKNSTLRPVNCSNLFGLEDHRYNCGLLQVPENYTLEDSNLIEIPVLLIFPETSNFDPSLEPLLVTGGGGPGNALLGNRYHPLTDSSFWTYEEFSVTDGRVLIIVENRGVGVSRPNLDCDYSADIYRDQYWSELLDSDLRCGQEYKSQGVDLSQYNVFNTALDIEMLRRLLGIRGINSRTLNLYGVSYGTRVALYYERLFPDATRTLVLDSVSVNDPAGSADDLLYAQRALDRVFNLCRSDRPCRERFGSELESDFYAFLEGIENRDISIELNWPGKVQPISVPLTGSLIVDMLHSALYSSDTLAEIPLTVSQTIAGSYTRLQSGLNDYIQSYAPEYTFSDTAFLTYRCADTDYTAKVKVNIDHLSLSRYWDFDNGREYMNRVCAKYNIIATANLLQMAYKSDTPTLFLSGELDPVTPPDSAEKASQNYNYHWNFVENNTAHDVVSHSHCARYLISWFLYHPQEDLERRQSDCAPVESIKFRLD